jgi:plasmid rolling circle replication initiator protein Rep
VDELRDTLTRMNKAWDKLVKRKAFPAIGFFKSVEVTRNNDLTSEWYGTAHPHFHVLMMVNSSYFRYGYLNQKDWAQMWQECLKVDYEPMVNVKIVKPKGEAKVLDADSLMYAVKEVLKYTVKEEELVIDQAWIVELAKQLHKTRAVSVGGVLKDYLSEEDVTEEEMLSGDDQDDDSQSTDEHWSFGWREDYKRYLKLENVG